jgi:hypothetical protein
MPLQRRLPKRGFKSPPAEVQRRSDPDRPAALGAAEVDLLSLKQAGLVGELAKVVKVIKSGELSLKVRSRASAPPPAPRRRSKRPAARSPEARGATHPTGIHRKAGSVATNSNQLAKSGKFGDLRRRLVFLLLALVVTASARTFRCRASIRTSSPSCSRASRAAS